MSIDWMDRGACRQADAELFFDVEGERGSSKKRRAEAAKRICESCPVRRECLQWALDRDEQFGVAGAATAEERRLWKAGRGRLAAA